MLPRRFSNPARRLTAAGLLACAIMLTGCTSNEAENVPQAAAEPVSAASSEAIYTQYCASCHGVSGIGDGPAADQLRVEPPNLRLLAQKNGGDFPIRIVQSAIDGRGMPRAHGSAEMPVWGRRWQREGTTPAEIDIKVRVLAITNYLRAIQD